MTTTTRHKSTHYALNEAQKMYDSEIDFLLVGFWDGGIDWFLGNAPSADGMVEDAVHHHTSELPRRGNGATIEEALVDVANAARAAFPESEFARFRPTSIELVPCRLSLEEKFERIREATGADVDITFNKSTDPYTPQYTAFGGGHLTGYAGYTLEEAVDFLASQSGVDLQAP